MSALRLYTMKINDNDETGVDINSFVSAPAHMKSFEVYGREKEHYQIDNEKRQVTGVMILADTPIYRNDKQLGEHFVSFPPNVIEQIRNKFFMQRYNVNTNVEHSAMVDGATLVESYIVDSKNRYAPGVPQAFAKQGITDGSLIVTYYISNEKLWQDCKKGTFKGFSVEGFFDKVQTNIKLKKTTMAAEKKKNRFMEAIFGKDKHAEVTTVDGTVLTYDGELKAGTVMVGADGKPAKPGEYSCELEGKTYAFTLDDNGAITSIEEVEAMSDLEEQMAEAVKKVNDETTEAFAAIGKENKALEQRIKALEDFLSKDGKFSAHKGGKKTGGGEKPAWRK